MKQILTKTIDLTSNNYIQDMVFKGKEEWLISGFELKIVTIETKAEYSAIKVSDLITSVKETKKKEIKHGSFHTQLPNFKDFYLDHLVNYSLPEEKYYIYYNTGTKEIDEIKFPDYKKWYKEGKAVRKPHAYGNAQVKLENVNDTTAKSVIRRRHDYAVNTRKLLRILKRMNKIYTKNGNRYNESTDWLHCYYVYSLSDNQELI